MQSSPDLFKPGAELFLENFREVSLFEAQVLENVKSRSIFEWVEHSVMESLLGVTSKCILVGQRMMLSKLTVGLSKAPTKIMNVYDIRDVLKCRHKEGPGGWLEIIFKNGAKLRIIMNCRQTECVALITKHVGGGSVRIQEPKDREKSTNGTISNNSLASADENGQGGKDEPDRQDSEESSAQPTDAEIKEMMKEYTV